MNVAQLWITGSEADLATVCSLLALDPDSSWRQGDKIRNGKVHEDNGVGISIADANSPRELVEDILLFVARCEVSNINFKKFSLAADLSLGYTVGDSEQFAACIEFTDQDLLRLAGLGISLSVWVYPTSDEANE
ncbi:hypothetical protein [Gallaecimonas sp. GXIMD4217]|uniref:hypothetical protein n=1 Tax=Gallaecimonas sp. GXIMD4217 TaxID=3131927 RepID=UPI00311B2BE4